MNQYQASRAVCVWCAAALLVGLTPASAVTLPEGSGGYSPPKLTSLTPEERARIRAECDHTIDSLRTAGVLAAAGTLRKAQRVLLDWPLVCELEPGQFDCFTTTQHVDHDTGSSGVLDYTGGDRTYNGHWGSDYVIFPFPWYGMDSGRVHIVAAAPGVIVGTRRGNPDRSCSSSDGTQWNAVYVQHADGSVAWYGHMKTGSLTSKDVGDSVVAGEYLGLVGSSGRSTTPHLHFELHDADWNHIDPYAGPANILNSESWWRTQRSYNDRALLRLSTHLEQPVFPPCPEQEVPNIQTRFLPGDRIYFYAFFRSLMEGDTVSYTIRQPDGETAFSWDHVPGPLPWVSSYFYWYRTLAGDAPTGQWHCEVVFDGVTYETTFQVGEDLAVSVSAAGRRTHRLDASRCYGIDGRVVPGGRHRGLVFIVTPAGSLLRSAH